MADPQETTDAQLSDGTILRFMGRLEPNQVRQKVQAYRMSRPDLQAPPSLPSRYTPEGTPNSPNAPPMKMSALGSDPGISPQMPNRGGTMAQDIQRNPGIAELAGATSLAGGAALGAAGAGEIPVIGPLLQRGASKLAPVAKPLIGSALIEAAKQLPIVGPVVKKIPYAEMLPWLLSGSFGGSKGEGKPQRGKPTVADEVNPALTSESRTLPGQVGKEVIGARPTPAEPIPPRSGLMLPEPKPTPSNMPTAESRAASDAAFQQNYPKGVIPGKPMDPIAQRAFDESMGFRKPSPVEDPGTIARKANPEPTRAETKEPPTNQLDDLLRNAVGNQPVKPGVKIRDQYKPSTGFTPATDAQGNPSSALKEFKYDPDKQEFHAVTKEGGHYIYGQVPPEAAEKFAATDSKGTAWSELRKTPGVVQVGKVVNGKRQSTVPTSARSASPEDLTSTLQQMLDQARQRKEQ